MIDLHCLKHTYSLSDDEVVAHWVEKPYWQYFCGRVKAYHGNPYDGHTLKESLLQVERVSGVLKLKMFM